MSSGSSIAIGAANRVPGRACVWFVRFVWLVRFEVMLSVWFEMFWSLPREVVLVWFVVMFKEWFEVILRDWF